MQYNANIKKQNVEIDFIKGKIFTSFERIYNNMLFLHNDEITFMMHHEQQCCEHVYLADICGDLEDLINTPIVAAYASSNEEVEKCNKQAGPNQKNEDEDEDMCMEYTFYTIRTMKGTVVLRFIGESNGYYSTAITCSWYDKVK